MPADVNPFEPWRPPDFNPSLPDEVIHPWRAAPPADPGEEDLPAAEPRDGPAPPRSPSAANGLLVLLFLVLALGGLVALSELGGRHAVRIAAVCLTLFFGMTLGLSVLHRSRWYVRLAACAAAVGGSYAAYWLTPTYGGLSRWTATRRVEHLRGLMAADFAGFRAARPGVDEARREFPDLAADAAHSEAEWVARTVHAALQDIGLEAGWQPGGALDRLIRLEAAFQSVGQGAAVEPAIRRAVEAAAEGRLNLLQDEVAALTHRGQFLAAQDLIVEQGQALREKLGARADADALDRRLVEMRRALLGRHLDEGIKLLRRLAGEKKWDDATREARRLSADLLDAAAPFGEAETRRVRAELEGPCTQVVRGRLSAVAAAARKLLNDGEPEKAQAALRAARPTLEAEGAELKIDEDVRRTLDPLALRAVQLKIDLGGQALRALLDKKDYAAVAVKGAELTARLSDEARVNFEEARLRSAVTGVRVQAFEARLEEAREEATDLFVKDRYADVAKAVRRAADEMDAEAGLIGRREALSSYADGWAVVLRVAALAGKK